MSSASQKTSQQPGPYPYGGEAIWEEYLARKFGDTGRGYEGELALKEQQQDWLAENLGNVWNEYEGGFQNSVNQYLSDLGSISPVGISLGGQPVGNLIPQRPQELAAKQHAARTNLPMQKLAFMEKHLPTFAPQNPELSFLQGLEGLGLGIQGMRYGIPTQRTSANVDQGTLADIADWIGIGKEGWKLLANVGEFNIGDLWESYGPDSWSDLNPMNWF